MSEFTLTVLKCPRSSPAYRSSFHLQWSATVSLDSLNEYKTVGDIYWWVQRTFGTKRGCQFFDSCWVRNVLDWRSVRLSGVPYPSPLMNVGLFRRNDCWPLRSPPKYHSRYYLMTLLDPIKRRSPTRRLFSRPVGRQKFTAPDTTVLSNACVPDKWRSIWTSVPLTTSFLPKVSKLR